MLTVAFVLLVLLTLSLSGCGSWQCMAKPTLGTGPDAKQALRVNGFEVRCTKHF